MKKTAILFLFNFLAYAGFTQENRIVVLGKGLEEADDKIVARLAEDLGNEPAAVLLMGDYLRKRHRVDQNFLLSSPLGEALRSYEGPVYVIPGENEFGPNQINSTEHLAVIEQSLAEIDTSWHLIPSQGCPGPVQVEINDSFLLVFINTSRFFHDGHVLEAT
jgi:hypothetical protein